MPCGTGERCWRCQPALLAHGKNSACREWLINRPRSPRFLSLDTRQRTDGALQRSPNANGPPDGCRRGEALPGVAKRTERKSRLD